MKEKQVILAKTEYDAMEAELQDLRTIVANRTVVKIVEENLNWTMTWRVSNGTVIKYILGTDDDATVKDLAEQIKYLQKQLSETENQLFTKDRLLGEKSDEIKRLQKQTWYQKLFSR